MNDAKVMRILILGTSNSLIRNGWVSGLQAALPGVSIDNESVGASPGVQFATRIGRDLSVYDYILIDSIPNDELFASQKMRDGTTGFFSHQYQESIMFDVLSAARSQSNVVLIGVPRLDTFENASQVFNSRKSMAEQIGAKFFDIRPFVTDYASRNEFSISQCYEEHPAHPLRNIMFDAGMHLGTSIASGQMVNHGDFRPKAERRYVTYTHQDWPTLPFEVRRNSVMEDMFSILRLGDAIDFEYGDCIGYYINVANTYCSATLQDSSGKPLLTTRLYYPGGKDGLQKMFIPTRNGTRSCRLVCGNMTTVDTFGAGQQAYEKERTDYVLSVSQVCIRTHGADSRN